jgi:hypothetical protein
MSTSCPPKGSRFYLCDDVRPEATGKLTLVGLYPDDKILAQTPLNQQGTPGIVVISQMAIVCVLFDGDGIFDVTTTLKGPMGQSIANMILKNATFIPLKPLVLIMPNQQFPLSGFGQYTMTVEVGAATFRFDFEILLSQPGPPALIPPVPKKRKKLPRKPK